MGRDFVCKCEDIDRDEVMHAIADGYDDLESLRRFTALGTGPCQGKACLTECIRLLADHHDVDEEQVGLMTLRPPMVPMPLGHLSALPDELVLELLDGEEAEAERTLRAALQEDGPPRTGRPTPQHPEDSA